MQEKKELNQEQLENVNGGAGLDNLIHMNIGLKFKFSEEGNELYREIQLSFRKKFTTKVPDTEIKTACNNWCIENQCLYVSHTVISSYAI